MLKFLQATNITWSDSTATSVFENCPVIHCTIAVSLRCWRHNALFAAFFSRKSLWSFLGRSALSHSQITVPYLNIENGNRRLNIGRWYVFARIKGLKIYFFSTNSLNYVKYFLLILFQKLSIIFLPAKGRNLTTRFTNKNE
jgi:hypothetical protein